MDIVGSTPSPEDSRAGDPEMEAQPSPEPARAKSIHSGSDEAQEASHGARVVPPNVDESDDMGEREMPEGSPFVDQRRWLASPVKLDADEWPSLLLPAQDLLARKRRSEEVKRAFRRRRRYSFFVRRGSRARNAARTATVVRAAWATVLVMLLVIIAIIGTAIGAATSYYNSEAALLRGLPQQILSKDSLRIFDDKGALLYEVRTDGAQQSIALANVPIDVVNATVSIEDHDYWINQGIDFTSIARAFTADLQSGQVSQGGSTITQQLIKQQILGAQVDVQRKVGEAILALGITLQGDGGYSGFSKRQILEMYLNSIPYSPTAYGIEAAAQEYFGYQDNTATGETAAQQLDLAQASILAGVPQNPNTNDPLTHFDAAHARQKLVLQSMVNDGYISADQANGAYAEAAKPNFFHPVTSNQNLAPHFVAYVRDLLDQLISTGQLNNLARSGLNVYTTLDMDLQIHTQEAMKDHLFGSDPTGYCCALIRNSNVTNSAEIIADRQGAIKVYVGSVDYNNDSIDGKFDVVSQGDRPVGSSFKPYVYATAFEKGWFPALTVNDVPSTFWDAGSGQVYRPADFTSTEARGRVTLRTALDWSLNIPAVKVMQFAGISDVQALAERMGITQWKGTWGLSSVLGALDVTPYEMAQAYSVFQNYGQYTPLHAISQITNSAGDVLYNYSAPQPVQVMDPRIAFLITSILSDNASRAGDFGSCSPLYLAPYFGTTHPHYSSEGAAAGTSECASIHAHGGLSPNAWPTAAKTGTGQNFKDDWTMGYTNDYVAAVWVGNNNDTQMEKIDGVTGAAPIFYQSMIYAEASTGKAKTPFPVPGGVSQQKYCSQGVCTTDWFLNGAQPPQNLGESGDAIPCVTLLPDGGWNYAPAGHCDVALVPGSGQNIGAPKPTSGKYVGAP